MHYSRFETTSGNRQMDTSTMTNQQMTVAANLWNKTNTNKMTRSTSLFSGMHCIFVFGNLKLRLEKL